MTSDRELDVSTRRRRARSLVARFALLVLGYTILVIVWGALVRATGSGAGCGNHWPLCNGELIPVSPGVHTVIEFVHRAMTGGSSLLILALVAGTFWVTRPGHMARPAAVLSAVLLLNEAFLGALLVKLGYVTGNQSLGRVVVLSVHLTNTLLLLAALTATALLLRTEWMRRDLRSTLRQVPASRRVLVVAGLASTLLVGVSGSLAALGDTLFPSSSLRDAVAADFSAGSPWLLRLRWVHPLSAALAAALLVWLLRLAWRRRDWVGRLASVLCGLLVLQFALGIADVLLLAPVALQLIHLLGADLYWVALVGLSAGVLVTGQEPATAGVRTALPTEADRRRQAALS